MQIVTAHPLHKKFIAERVVRRKSITQSLTIMIGHELGHTVLWDVDHNPNDDTQSFGGNAGHHIIGQDGRATQHTIDCLMWSYFPPCICPNGFALCELFCPDRFDHWEWQQVGNDWIAVAPRNVGMWTVIMPTEFCNNNPDCQHLWHLNPH